MTTIQTWFDNYRDRGIAGLEPSKARRGFSGALHGQSQKELRKKLSEGSFRWSEDARVWVADEARFGLQPCLKRSWVTRGVKARKDSRISYQWLYVWGAVEVDGDESAYLYSEGADTEFSLSFLEQISRKDPDSEHAVIWDGAGFHPNGCHERIPENITVIQQPPDSPELNCIEKLWDMLRDGLCNRSWSDIDHLLEQATRWLKDFWETPEQIHSPVGDGWMLHQTNA